MVHKLGTTIDPNWRETWNTRKKIRNFATESAAESWIQRNQKKHVQPLKNDWHPKDGHVVYHD